MEKLTSKQSKLKGLIYTFYYLKEDAEKILILQARLAW